MAQLIPPIPKELLTPDSHVWRDWFNNLRNILVGAIEGTVAWAAINFTGSNITDLVSRRHSDLQNLQGGTAGQYYHLTATQLTNLGTVTTVSVATSNGFAGTVATATATPVITLSTSITGLLKGNGTAISAAISSTDYAPATSGTSILYGNSSGGFSNVTIGSGVSFTTGTLSATGSGGTVTSVTGTAGRVSSTGGTTPVIDLVSGIASAGTTGSVSLIPVVTIDTYGRVTSITTAANPQGTVTSVTGTAPVVSSGGATPAISMAAATTSVNGYLTSTDWTTFNNKVTSVSGTAGRVTSTGGATPVIDLVSGIATPGTIGSVSLIPVVTIDTYGRVTSITTAANPQGTVTSVAALTLGTTGTDLSSTVANGTTTPVITLQVPTASASNRGALSAADWTTFNNKGSGSVTSVAQSFTGGLISVAGSPITSSGTLALTVAGTSGGVPYFSSASTWATSAALAASSLVLGGGAGAAPVTTTTGTGVVTALGVNTGSAGAMVVNGGALGTPSSGTVTNLTGTASININGTVGATTANTGKFTSAAFPGTTSGTATIAATAVAGTPTLTLPTTTGTLSINGPAFSAYQSTSTAVTASTLTKVLFDVELFDTNSNFASSRFTPTVEGYYQVNARVGLSSSVLTRGVAVIRKNGANANFMEDTNDAAAYSSIGSALIYMNGSTDYLEIYVFIAGTTTIYDGGAALTWFQAAMVRGA